jgi:hypothetical protein
MTVKYLKVTNLTAAPSQYREESSTPSVPWIICSDKLQKWMWHTGWAVVRRAACRFEQTDKAPLSRPAAAHYRVRARSPHLELHTYLLLVVPVQSATPTCLDEARHWRLDERGGTDLQKCLQAKPLAMRVLISLFTTAETGHHSAGGALTSLLFDAHNGSFSRRPCPFFFCLIRAGCIEAQDIQTKPGLRCPTASVWRKGGCVCLRRGQNLCPTRCTNSMTDPKNCGSCGKLCRNTDAAGHQTCVGGTCGCWKDGRIRTFLPQGALCNLAKPSATRRACIDLRSDDGNCGGCGKTCSRALGRSCVDGRCIGKTSTPRVLDLNLGRPK